MRHANNLAVSCAALLFALGASTGCLDGFGNGADGDDTDKGISVATYEVTGIVKGSVIVPNWGTSEEQRAWIDKVMANPLANQALYYDTVVQQVKFFRNGLVPAGVFPNFIGKIKSIDSATPDVYGVRLAYQFEIRAAVLRKALPNGKALIGKAYTYKLPDHPGLLVTQTQQRCVTADHAIEDFNAFYYYSPGKAGCTAHKSAATFTVTSADVTDPIVYPEYDRLAADGVIKVAMMYGQSETEDLASDEVMLTVVSDLEAQLVNDMEFTSTGAILRDGVIIGNKYRRLIGDRRVELEVYNPRSMDLSLPAATVADTMERVFKSAEIILYFGHSRYGSLPVFDRPAAFASKAYQIFVLGSCHSYMYYADKVLAGKATAADPAGFKNVDILGTVKEGSFSDYAIDSNAVLTLATIAAQYEYASESDAWNSLLTSIADEQAQSSKDPFYEGGYVVSHYMLTGAEGNRFTP